MAHFVFQEDVFQHLSHQFSGHEEAASGYDAKNMASGYVSSYADSINFSARNSTENAFFNNAMSYSVVGGRYVRQKTELAERKFKCGYCGEAFKRKSHLTQHERRHTGEKPFVCPHCHKPFTQQASVANHVKICKMALPLFNSSLAMQNSM